MDKGQMDSKLPLKFRFTEEEKEELIKKYFMRYFMEKVEMTTELIKINTATQITSDKRNCSCAKGMIDEKTGLLIPPVLMK
jgi:hypothetical protein